MYRQTDLVKYRWLIFHTIVKSWFVYGFTQLKKIVQGKMQQLQI